MVKDNKFAAEPSADGTADAKVDRSGKPKSSDAVQPLADRITTTDNAEGHGNDDASRQAARVAKLNKKDVYNRYVNGDVIDDIAADNNVSSHDVVNVINETEAKKK